MKYKSVSKISRLPNQFTAVIKEIGVKDFKYQTRESLWNSQNIVQRDREYIQV